MEDYASSSLRRALADWQLVCLMIYRLGATTRVPWGGGLQQYCMARPRKSELASDSRFPMRGNAVRRAEARVVETSEKQDTTEQTPRPCLLALSAWKDHGSHDDFEGVEKRASVSATSRVCLMRSWRAEKSCRRNGIDSRAGLIVVRSG